MTKQLTLPLEQPIIERIAQRFDEAKIYYMARREWLPEHIADKAIKMRRAA